MGETVDGTTGTTGVGPPLGLTPSCIVTIRADGIQLQGPIQAPPFYIGRPELEMLAMLDGQTPASLDALAHEVAQRTGAEPAALIAFVKRLRLARHVAEKAPAPSREVVDHATLNSRERFDLDSPQLLALRVPLVLAVRDGHFEIFDHDGLRTAVLSPSELTALAALIQPSFPRDALAAVRQCGDLEMRDEEQFAELLGRLDGAGLLRTTEASEDAPLLAADREVIVREIFNRHAAAQDEAEHERERRTGRKRVKVIPVAFDMGTPAGLGMVVACAKAFESGRLEEVYNFRTDWVWNDERLDEFTAEPAVYLFSNYLWSHERCIEISKQVKERSPGSITIHGGPDTPKYVGDAKAYFSAHPHVDIAIRGEGEVSATETLAALATVAGAESPDLSVLAGIPGITYRDGDRVVRNPDRDRVADLNTLPSPFLTGLFDVYSGVPELFVTLETNRGCPYSCTFCDWGSATASRIRQFDMERVFGELEWCSAARVTSVSVADANYGMFKRDVEIAQKVADLRLATGHPRAFGVSYAKNTVKHLQHIIMVLADAGIMTQGVLSLQSMDPTTLDTIHRSNIKTERYDALADEMRRARLPLMVELMMGLPGQTLETFADDLQECIEREVAARINHTTLLVNSPMNDPEYLAEHQIKTAEPVGPGLNSGVISTSSFSFEDYGAMERLRLAFMLYENWGALRHVSRFTRHETGMREIDLYREIRVRTTDRRDEWPALYALAVYGSSMMTAPYSWAIVMDDLRRFLVSEFDVADGAALGSVLRAQRALLPAHGRRFPEVVPLTHDVVAWHHDMLVAKAQGHRRDWPQIVPRLATYGPAELLVDDPDHVVDTSIGLNRELNVVGVNWELDSPLSRARLATGQFIDWVTDTVVPQRAPGKAATVSQPSG